jgi:glycosyltransferase involved in cell wall biosynthesis/SAM-dependent methyltransferase
MRVALFSPMPPAKSGIADYSAALAEPLGRLVELEIFDGSSAAFDPARFDIALYQVGNNACHSFVYEAALEHPGVTVLHEANLHHLIAETTIRRGDWDAYLREVEYAGGAEALAHAQRARALETGPDYEGVPMTRRLIERSRGIVVHSDAVLAHVRAAGFAGPVARIPHGAWVADADRCAWRERLGIDEGAPLVGIFGFLKPYKRIPECLRAFRRLLRLEPRARMILVGEPHPDLAVDSLIASLGLAGNVRVLGFQPIDDFTGCIAACDVVLNLRYPTVGETSGSLLRALGIGRPVVVSDVGAFCDLPDDICLKVPVGPGEEDEIFEFLSLLVSRPDLARSMGARARAWVERECTWNLVARRYAEFLECVVGGRDRGPGPLPDGRGSVEAATPETILKWAPPDAAFRAYVHTHLSRLTRTLEIIPPGGPADRILEMGAYLQITPSLGSRLGYGEVRGCYYGQAGTVEHRSIVSAEGERFECDLDLFDAEKDAFPYPDAHFAAVLCCELIEHLSADPMHMLAEVNRILRDGGHLVLTTPNIASLRAISAILQGYNPGLFPQYIKPGGDGEVAPRHNREYTPREVHLLLCDAGFEVVRLETGPFRDQPRPELAWVRRLLERYWLSGELRDEGIYAVGRKAGPVRNRYPEWLYA